MLNKIKKFDFTIFILDLRVSEACIEDRLFEAGCYDALICSIDKNIYLEFTREAENLDLAIHSALNDIKLAGCREIQIKN